MQPRPSRVVVTVRPASSVWDEEAVALARPPSEEEDALEDETETDERDEPCAEAVARTLPFRRCVRIETDPGSEIIDRTSRPFGRMRVTAQVAPPPSAGPTAANADAATAAMCGKGIAHVPTKGLASKGAGAACYQGRTSIFPA